VLIAVLYWAFSPKHAADLPELYGEYPVIRVVDGDTIVVSIDGTDTKVRFIGIDTPESVHPDKSKNTPDGKAAFEYTARLLDGKSVCLEYDAERLDSYGRTLAYVWLDDVMVNRLLLKQGYAVPLTIAPNTRYAEEFEEFSK
jgi:micrococcal nuclease